MSRPTRDANFQRMHLANKRVLWIKNIQFRSSKKRDEELRKFFFLFVKRRPILSVI